MQPTRIIFAAAALLVMDIATVAAQQPAAAQPPAQQPPAAGAPPQGANVTNVNEARLVFEREVFDYPGGNRRDPFEPQTGQNSGPQFVDLELHMIINTGDPRTSMAAVSDASKKMFRVRRGDTIGNATVVDIQDGRVVFSVSDFGVARTETLVMKGKERTR